MEQIARGEADRKQAEITADKETKPSAVGHSSRQLKTKQLLAALVWEPEYTVQLRKFVETVAALGLGDDADIGDTGILKRKPIVFTTSK